MMRDISPAVIALAIASAVIAASAAPPRAFAEPDYARIVQALERIARATEKQAEHCK